MLSNRYNITCILSNYTTVEYNMKIGIVGRPHVGKTTVFNALAQSNAEVGNYTEKKRINLSTVTVPDERLDPLAEVFQAKMTVPATIDYIDGGGTSRLAIKSNVDQPINPELDASVLAELRTVNALAHVVRLFEDETVPHVDGNVDGERDIEAVNLEFVFADLQIIDGRLNRLEKLLKNEKTPEYQNEFRILQTFKQTLEDGKPLRSIDISDTDEKLIRGYGFLTLKPLLIICNISELQLQDLDEVYNKYSVYANQPQTDIIVLAAQLEMEIAQLDAADAEVFMVEMGLEQSALERFIQTSYQLMGLITFFTGGEKEARAWNLRKGQTAVEAAGAIHTDFERGFVRSECINWKELVNCGSYSQARSKGLLRAEGKTYLVQEGDVLTILANPTN